MSVSQKYVSWRQETLESTRKIAERIRKENREFKKCLCETIGDNDVDRVIKFFALYPMFKSLGFPVEQYTCRLETNYFLENQNV